MKKIISTILTCIILLGCSKKEITITVITPYLNNEKINLSEIVKDYKLVVLETTPMSLIADLSKVIIENEIIYVFDRVSMSVLIFDITGKFISKISSIGHGPGEYIAAIDFDVYYDEICILDYSGKKILVYNNSFAHIRTVNIPYFASQVLYSGDSFLIKCEPTTDKTPYLVKINRDGSTVYENDLLMPAGQFNWGGLNVFGRNSSDIFFSKPFENKIYNFHNELQTVYQLDFGNNNIPENISMNEHNPFQEGFEFAFKYSYLITDNWLVADYFYKLKRFQLFINLNTSEHYSGIIINSPNEYPFFPRWAFHDGLLGSIQPFELHQFEGFINHWPDLKNLNPNDNPILIFYNI
jgi:hypothetical protein